MIGERFSFSTPEIDNLIKYNYTNVQGMTTDISLMGIQFNVATSIFYVTYVLIEMPAIVVKKAKFNRMIRSIPIGLGSSFIFVQDLSRISQV